MDKMFVLGCGHNPIQNTCIARSLFAVLFRAQKEVHLPHMPSNNNTRIPVNPTPISPNDLNACGNRIFKEKEKMLSELHALTFSCCRREVPIVYGGDESRKLL